MSSINRSEITHLILESLREVLADAEDQRSQAPLTESSPLIGAAGLLDSMGLVTVVVEVEQRLEEEYGISVILADERAMSEAKSPFRTVATLTDYVVRQMSDDSEDASESRR